MRNIGILMFFLAFTFFSCKKNSDNHADHDHGEGSHEESSHAEEGNSHAEDEDHEDEGNVAELSDLQMKTMGFIIGPIEERPIGETIKAYGYLKVPTMYKANATSMFSGIVKTLNVQIGDFVRKGQVIAIIENPDFLTSQEELLNLQNRLGLSVQELERQKMLNEGGAGALKNLQSAEAEISNIKTRIAALQKRLRLMGINPSKLNAGNLQAGISVLSPISGSVSEVGAKIGSNIDVSTPVAEIIDNSQLHLDLEVYERDIKYMKLGQRINFILSNNPGQQYDAEIHTIGSTFEGESKTIAMHATIVGKVGGLIDGMSVTGLIHTNETKTLAVPNEALLNSGGKFYVFLKKGYNVDSKTTNLERVEVIPGRSELGYTAINPIGEIPKNAEILKKGAFFANATLEEIGGHSH